MNTRLQKAPEIHALLEQLRRDLGDEVFIVRDHWEADLCAIGLAPVAPEGLLAYVSVLNLPQGMFFLELERSGPRSDQPQILGTWERLDYTELRRILAEHLRSDMPAS